MTDEDFERDPYWLVVPSLFADDDLDVRELQIFLSQPELIL